MMRKMFGFSSGFDLSNVIIHVPAKHKDIEIFEREKSMGKRVIRLKASGRFDAGLGPWDNITHGNIISGDARDRSDEAVNKELRLKGRMRVGVWEAKAYTEKLVDYPCDEFMVVIEGSCTIVEEDGNREDFTQGDCFFLPKGFNGYWEQQETMKKYFMIVESD